MQSRNLPPRSALLCPCRRRGSRSLGQRQNLGSESPPRSPRLISGALCLFPPPVCRAGPRFCLRVACARGSGLLTQLLSPPASTQPGAGVGLWLPHSWLFSWGSESFPGSENHLLGLNSLWFKCTESFCSQGWALTEPSMNAVSSLVYAGD